MEAMLVRGRKLVRRGVVACSVGTASILVAAMGGAIQPASAGTFTDAAGWGAFYYNPEMTSLSGPIPAGTGSDATFKFASEPAYTSLLVTSQPSLVGDLSSIGTLSATVSTQGVSAAATWIYGFEGQPINPCPTPASVRFYIRSGETFAGTNFWWSDTGYVDMTGTGGLPSQSVSTDLSPADWSDINGNSASTETAAFQSALQDVKSIGLSFGGGCFFENGVTTSDGSGYFQLSGFTES